MNYSVLENSMFDDKIRFDDCSVDFQALVGRTMTDSVVERLLRRTFLYSDRSRHARRSNFCPDRSGSSGGSSLKRTYSTGIDTDDKFDSSLPVTFCWTDRAVN